MGIMDKIRASRPKITIETLTNTKKEMQSHIDKFDALIEGIQRRRKPFVDSIANVDKQILDLQQTNARKYGGDPPKRTD